MPRLTAGDPAPRFILPTTHSAEYHFDSLGGHHVAVLFVPHLDAPGVGDALAALAPTVATLDVDEVVVFLVTRRASDRGHPLAQRLPWTARVFFDDDGRVSALWGVATGRDDDDPEARPAPVLFLLDRRLCVRGTADLVDPAQFATRIGEILTALPERATPFAAPSHPPVILVPDVFEAAFCGRLIAYFESQPPRDSGFMLQVGESTYAERDYGRKRRSDVSITDELLRQQVRARMTRRLFPWLQTAFHYRPTVIERYVIGRYDGEVGGHFRPHRDDTTTGTAHRRFAVSINLNRDFEGGELTFPEFGSAHYKPEPGQAVVFSCSLLHQALPVTAGRRYAFLPFLYDFEAADLRDRNRASIRQREGGAPTPPVTESA